MPDLFSCIDTTINGISVRVYRLAHGPYYTEDSLTGEKINRHQNVQNVGFLFNIDGVNAVRVVERTEFTDTYGKKTVEDAVRIIPRVLGSSSSVIFNCDLISLSRGI